ncbi:MAG: putative Ig domain-containing protein [Planctomycetes bacterium]|nr:putative Ig domain-containing protein [Planctomycetota bacterium]
MAFDLTHAINQLGRNPSVFKIIDDAIPSTGPGDASAGPLTGIDVDAVAAKDAGGATIYAQTVLAWAFGPEIATVPGSFPDCLDRNISGLAGDNPGKGFPGTVLGHPDAVDPACSGGILSQTPSGFTSLGRGGVLVLLMASGVSDPNLVRYIDPVDQKEKGYDLFFFDAGGAIFILQDPFDGAGQPVPCGLLLAWVASLTQPHTSLAPGENEIFVVHLSAAPGAQTECSAVQFLEEFRSKPDSPPQKNAVTVNGTAMISAATEDTVFCLCRPLQIELDSLPDAGVQDPYQGKDFPYSHSIPVSGGTPPYTWAIRDGSLPPGLFLDPLTGRISGAPLPGSIGNYPFTVEVCDSCLCEGKILEIQVASRAEGEPLPSPGGRHGGDGCGAVLPISRGNGFWDAVSGLFIYLIPLGILFLRKMNRPMAKLIPIIILSGCVTTRVKLEEKIRHEKVAVFSEDSRFKKIENLIYEHLIMESVIPVEREKLKKIMEEKGIQPSEEATIDAARVLGASYLIIVSIDEMIANELSYVGDPLPPPQLVISSHITSVETGRIVGAGYSRASLIGLQTFHKVMSYPTLFIWTLTFQPLINGLFAPSRQTLFDWTVGDHFEGYVES